MSVSAPTSHVSPLLLAAILAALATIGPFSIDTFLPAMNTIGTALHASPIAIQQALTVYLGCYGVMMLWHGALSDAIGRRPVILGALSIFSLASIGCTYADTLTELLLYRAVQGLSGGAGLIVGRAIIRDTFEGAAAQRLMSHVTMMFSLSPAIAPVIGGWLYQGFGWRSIFLFMALIGVLLCALCIWKLPETHPKSQHKTLNARNLLANYRHVAQRRSFRWLAGVLAFNFAGMFVYIPSAPVFVMQHLQLGATDFLWLFGPAVSGIMGGSWLSGKLAGRRSPREIVRLGYRCMGIAAFSNIAYCLWFPPMLPFSVIPLTVYTFGMSLTTPSITIYLLDIFPDLRGTVSSMQGFVQTLFATFVAGAIVPMLWHSPLSIALGMGGFMLLGWLMLQGFRRHHVDQSLSL